VIERIANGEPRTFPARLTLTQLPESFSRKMAKSSRAANMPHQRSSPSPSASAKAVRTPGQPSLFDALLPLKYTYRPHTAGSHTADDGKHRATREINGNRLRDHGTTITWEQ